MQIFIALWSYKKINTADRIGPCHDNEAILTYLSQSKSKIDHRNVLLIIAFTTQKPTTKQSLCSRSKTWSEFLMPYVMFFLCSMCISKKNRQNNDQHEYDITTHNYLSAIQKDPFKNEQSVPHKKTRGVRRCWGRISSSSSTRVCLWFKKHWNHFTKIEQLVYYNIHNLRHQTGSAVFGSL